MLKKIALVGHPNTGKTSLFNALTQGRSKVANYPGVTVEKIESQIQVNGEAFTIIDLPGAYSLDAKTLDEKVTRDVILGNLEGESRPDLMIIVVDATNLRRTLGMALEIQSIGIPMVLAVNMIDLANARGQRLDLKKLSELCGADVIQTVATKGIGISDLKQSCFNILKTSKDLSTLEGKSCRVFTTDELSQRYQLIDEWIRQSTLQPLRPSTLTTKIDKIILHPVYGSVILMSVLFLIFQAVFSWAKVPQEWISQGVEWLSTTTRTQLGDGFFSQLLSDGVITGVGAVVVFLPQILILFAMILILEDSGYMSRAAFMMDRLMSRVGLHGRAFIPLLSSFACAIPGIMATRTIENKRDRLTTMLVAPLMTCSARLPVYTLLVGAFIPDRVVLGFLNLKGLVLFALYVIGVVAALLAAWVMKKTIFKAETPTFLLELPTYKMPSIKNLIYGIRDRAIVFLRRAGTVILSISIVLWVVTNYPKPPVGSTLPPIQYSLAGQVGHALEPLVRPLGFDWKIAVALIPGFAAREVMISALATVYAVESKSDESVESELGQKIKSEWSLATALSLMMWYVFALQCLSTIAVLRRETNSLRWPLFALTYLTTLAYLASFATYRLASLI
jgi:ferrous iron transport protein B